ncbi:MAG TPA: glycerophosphodiester phosphodiesterase family protein [Candidatus Avamphibacillus sp.]|nr:glycerophosphodiester phosphodiesterase family protein [Candidatus Avamphibacillus sp.]
MVFNFAHRGSLTEAPENTLSAMEKALEHGARGIELDVQLTKDKQLVVIHDHHFKRLNKSVTGRINDYTLTEIKEIDIGSQFHEQFAGETLATLDEVLEVVPPDIVLNIEIKNIPLLHEGIEDILVDCLTMNHREENIIISSFDHVALEKVQKRAPHLPIGLLFYYRFIRPWEYAKQTGLDVYSIHPNAVYLDKELIDACHAAGYRVFPFTVNREEDYRKLVEAGVDGVFSNNPRIFGTV